MKINFINSKKIEKNFHNFFIIFIKKKEVKIKTKTKKKKKKNLNFLVNIFSILLKYNIKQTKNNLFRFSFEEKLVILYQKIN